MDTTQSKTNRPPPPPPPRPSKPLHLSSSKPTNSSQVTKTKTSKKRGLGWPWDYLASHVDLYISATSRISWLFNWELWVPAGLPADSSIEWIPTIRTAAQVNDIDPFLSDISRNHPVVSRSGITHLLGFNEPEIPDQANLSPVEAARLWKEFVLPAKRKFGFRLGSPGMSSDTSRSKPWLKEFYGQFEGGVKGAEIDFLVLHWYGPRFEDFASFLGDMYQTHDRSLPIWVNEFACSKLGAGEPSREEVERFMRQSVDFLEATDWIERYAYFGNGQGMDVGTWVGKENNFLVQPTATATASTGAEGGPTLSQIGKLYLELR